MNDDLSLRLLRPADLPDLMRLKASANWNQVERDWERLMELEPEGCFGIWAGPTLAATATALTYGTDLAWIGMVLTLPEFRGRGLASRLMTRSIEFLESRGVIEVKLDATNLGIEIYRRFGFIDECPIERWERAPGPLETAPAPLVSSENPIPTALDQAAFGTDRNSILEHLRASSRLAATEDGYAMARAGSRAAYIGPCVARDAATARALIGTLLVSMAEAPVYWDLFPGHPAESLARSFGFAPARQLTRMTRVLQPGRARIQPDNNLVFAIAGFEFG